MVFFIGLVAGIAVGWTAGFTVADIKRMENERRSDVVYWLQQGKTPTGYRPSLPGSKVLVKRLSWLRWEAVMLSESGEVLFATGRTRGSAAFAVMAEGVLDH